MLRGEKRNRNYEAEQFLHKKGKVERLLDELNSSDWLRVLGVPGVAETDKQHYAGRRDYCVKELEAQLEKFRKWKEEEKKRKEEKKALSSAEDTTDAQTTTDADSGLDSGVDSSAATSIPDHKLRKPLKKRQKSKLREISTDFTEDDDTLAARQLEQEATASTSNGEAAIRKPGQQKITSWFSKPKVHSTVEDHTIAEAAKRKRKRDEESDEAQSRKSETKRKKKTHLKITGTDDTKTTKTSKKRKADTEDAGEESKTGSKATQKRRGNSEHEAVAASAPPARRRPVKAANADLRNISPDPEDPPTEYSLPACLITADAVKASERRRRMAKRDRAAAVKDKNGNGKGRSS